MNGPFETYLGIKVGTLIAGLIGAIVSLSFIPNLTWPKAIIAIFTGAASAGYVTPLVIGALEVGPDYEHAVAFLVGLLGMNVLAGVFKMAERFKNSPVEFLRNVKNGKAPPDGD